MLTGEPLVPEGKAANDELMLAWIIAMSEGTITQDMAMQCKLGDNYFDKNGMYTV